jgi:drug/metabolite transporter, DME family
MSFLKSILHNGPLLIIIAACLWALDGVIRRSLYTLPPITIVFFEHLIGSLLILPFIFKQLIKLKFDRREILLLFWISLFSSLLGTLWFTTALLKVNFISFSVVYLLLQLEPIFALTTANLFLGEKISRRYLIWAGLAIIAAYFVIFKNGVVNLNTGAETVTAALFALGAAFAWGSSTTFSKMALSKKPDQVITGLRFIITTFLAFGGIFLLRASDSITQVDTSQLLRFIFIAVSTGMVALLLYYKGLKLTPVRVTTILELTFPVLAITIDAFYYNSFLSPTQLFAAAILMFSIYKISKLQLKNQI